jgi:hypothetical protein
VVDFETFPRFGHILGAGRCRIRHVDTVDGVYYVWLFISGIMNYESEYYNRGEAKLTVSEPVHLPRLESETREWVSIDDAAGLSRLQVGGE